MLDEKLLVELKEYISSHLNRHNFAVCESVGFLERSICEDIRHNELENYIKKTRKQTFSQALFSFIDKKGITDSEIYKKAGIDRRHFSKIRSNPDYHIGKNTAIALALSLELDKKEADKLLSAAGYTLSECETFDLVIQFCIEKKIYDIHSVNQALDYFSLNPLAGVNE